MKDKIDLYIDHLEKFQERAKDKDKLERFKKLEELRFLNSQLHDTYAELIEYLQMKNEKLENEINELKNKKEQYEQIEIPQDLADTIEYYKRTFHFNTEKVVTLILQISKLKNMDNVTQDTFQVKEYLQKNENGLLNIITAIINGYTIKKEPTDILRDNIFFVIDDEAKVSKIMELIKKFNESEN